LRPNSPEELWVRRQAGAVANDLSLPGANNADFPITVVPVQIEGRPPVAPPSTQTVTPQQTFAAGPVPMADLLPEPLKRLVPFFFPDEPDR
jgi:hypothetical protein